jgi:NTE family protein
MNARGGEWMTDVRLGENAMLFSEVYQPFSGPGGYFVAPRLYYKRDPVQVYNEEGASSLVTVKRFGGGLDLGRALGNWGEVRLGLDRESQNAKRELGDGAVQELDYEEGRTYLRFGVDTQDRTVFPTSGVKAFAQYAYSFEELGADQSMAQAEVAFLGVRTWGRFSASAAIVLGGISEDDPSIPRFKAGGLGRLSGYGLDRIFGNYQGLARVGGHYRVLGLNLGPYDMPVYAGLTLDAGNVWMLEDDISWDSVEYHGAVYLGIDSLAGPIMIAYGRGPEGMNAFYFLMGWPFQ